MTSIDQLLINKILKTEDKIYFNTDGLSTKQKQKLIEYQSKIAAGYPVDYILGKIQFLGQSFVVDEEVFIPRWETEWWIGEIIKAKNLKNNIFGSSISQGLNLTGLVVEIGAGTGIIGLSICPYFTDVLACDINPKAISLSKKNQLLLGIKNYQIYNSNSFENPKLKARITAPWILAANLPYVPMIDYQNRADNKILYEPTEAIFSGDDGLELYGKVLEEIQDLPPKIAFFELDPRNIKNAERLAKKIFKTTTIYKDPDGLDRLLVCQI